jgi:hypothetical protein
MNFVYKNKGCSGKSRVGSATRVWQTKLRNPKNNPTEPILFMASRGVIGVVDFRTFKKESNKNTFFAAVLA